MHDKCDINTNYKMRFKIIIKEQEEKVRSGLAGNLHTANCCPELTVSVRLHALLILDNQYYVGGHHLLLIINTGLQLLAERLVVNVS